MLKALKRAGSKRRFSARDFERQRELLGYCFVTEMLCAEGLEQEGDWQGALALYRGMVRAEPGNPWGHLLLGGLLARGGEFAAARKSYRELVRLVPNHLPGHVALGEIALELGDAAAARRHFADALKLDPKDPAALEGLAQACRHRRGE